MYRLSCSFTGTPLSKPSHRVAAVLLAICLCFSALAAQAVDATTHPSTIHPPLSPAANEVAKDLDLLPDVQELLDAENTSGKDSLEALRVREKLVESVLTGSLEIRSAISRIDAEISSTNELRDVMSDKRESRTQTSDVVNFMSAGTTTIINNALTEFATGRGLQTGGGAVGVVGGALQIGISTISLRLNKGEHRSAPIKPNMLAPLFGYAGPEAKFNEGVWSYLNDIYPQAVNSGETRRRHLVNQWMRIGRIAPLNTKQGQQQVAVLIGLVPQRKAITIDLLEDRALMLSDLRAAISQMDIEMLEIMRWVKTL